MKVDCIRTSLSFRPRSRLLCLSRVMLPLARSRTADHIVLRRVSPENPLDRRAHLDDVIANSLIGVQYMLTQLIADSKADIAQYIDRLLFLNRNARRNSHIHHTEDTDRLDIE